MNEKKITSCHRDVLCKRVLTKFAKFTGKHLHWSIFLLELQISGVFMWILQNFRSTFFVKQKWRATFENHVILTQLNDFTNSNLMAPMFAHRIGNTYTVKVLNLIRSSCHRCSGLQFFFKKKRFWHKCFPVNFAKFLKTLFLTKHLRWLFLFYGDWVFYFPGGGFPVF